MGTWCTGTQEDQVIRTWLCVWGADRGVVARCCPLFKQSL